MCKLHRRDFLLGLSGLALSACAGSDEYPAGKDYYPVASGSSILHWGKNSTIKIDTNANGAAASTAYLTAFKKGTDAWIDTLSGIGVTLEYTTSSPDVKVNWYEGSEVASGVLGYAGTDKKIVMTNTKSWTETKTESHSASTIEFVGIHEFGHMLGLWNHSFDINDIMYPYAAGPMTLSNRDKKTVSDFLYQMTPAYDMHDMPGPLNTPESSLESPPSYTSYLTINGCKIQS